MSVSCMLLSPGRDLPSSSVWWTRHKSIWLQRTHLCCLGMRDRGGGRRGEQGMTGKYGRKGWNKKEARGCETSWQRRRAAGENKQNVNQGAICTRRWRRSERELMTAKKKQREWHGGKKGKYSQNQKFLFVSFTHFFPLTLHIIMILCFRNTPQYGPQLHQNTYNMHTEQSPSSPCDKKASPPDCFMLSQALALTAVHFMPIVFFSSLLSLPRCWLLGEEIKGTNWLAVFL